MTLKIFTAGEVLTAEDLNEQFQLLVNNSHVNTLNSVPQYTFNGNIVVNSAIIANSAMGATNQVLASDGNKPYWVYVSALGSSINTAAQFNWSNDHTFSDYVTFSNLVTFGNTTVNTTINSSSISVTDVIVSGNLTVSGTTTSINTIAFNVSDPIVTLNADHTGAPTDNVGLEVNRGTSTNAYFYFDETNDKWQANDNLKVAGTFEAGNSSVTGFVNATVSVNSAILSVGTNLIANTTGLYHTGAINSTSVNAASHTVGSNFIANTTGAYHTGTMNAASFTTTGVTANVTGVYPTSNTSGQNLGTDTQRFDAFLDVVNLSGSLTSNAGANAILLTNATSNWIYYNTAGVAAPAATTRSAGTKIILYPNIGAASVDYAIGIEGSTLWQSVSTTSNQFKWYANVTNFMSANTTGLYHTGLINATTVNATTLSTTSFSANSTLVNAAALNITNQINTATLYATTSANIASVVQANTSGLFNTANTTLGSDSADRITFNAYAASSLIPAANATYDLGAPTTGYYKNVYSNAFIGTIGTFLGDVTVGGNLTITGSTVSLSGNTITFTDNMLYLNQGILATITGISSNGTHVIFTANNNYSAGWDVAVTGVTPASYNGTYLNIFAANSTTFTVANTNVDAYVSGGTARGKSDANPDLGFAAGYNDGTYHHAGFFRDASDGRWKVFDNYDPEPDTSIYIDTTNLSFHFADFEANSIYGGNTSVDWFVANTTGVYHTGTVNAASHTVGTSFTANSTVVNAVAYNISTTFIANTTGVYHTGIINAASFTVGASLVANSTGVYHTGTVNAASYTVGTAFVANTTGIYHTGTIAQSLIAGTLVLNGSTGSIVLDSSGHKRISWNDGAGNFNIRAGNFFNGTSLVYAADGATSGGAATIQLSSDAADGTVSLFTAPIGANGTAVTYSTSLVLNTTFTAIVANLSVTGNTTITGYVNATSSINASSFTVGTAFTANSTVVNAVAYNIGTTYVANTLGLYHTGTVNAASHSVGTAFTANSTVVNAVAYNIGTTYVANTLGLYHSGTVGIGTAPTSVFGLNINKTYTTDASTYGSYTGTLIQNTTLTAARSYFGRDGIVQNISENKDSLGTPLNSSVFGSRSVVYNGNSASGGDAFLSAAEGYRADVRNYANGATSNTITTARGVYSLVRTFSTGTIGTAYGVTSLIQPAAANATLTGNITAAYAFDGRIGLNSANASITNGYLYYGNYPTSANVTNKWGIVITGEDHNTVDSVFAAGAGFQHKHTTNRNITIYAGYAAGFIHIFTIASGNTVTVASNAYMKIL